MTSVGRRLVTVLGFALTLGIVLPSPVRADLSTYTFERITSNASVDIANQLSVSVSNDGLAAGQVAFTFRNEVGVASNLTEVYFDDGTLLGIASVVNSSGVYFGTQYSLNPADLPGRENLSPAFETTQGFGIDSANVTVRRGTSVRLLRERDNAAM